MHWLRSLNNYFRQVSLMDAKSRRNLLGKQDMEYCLACSLLIATVCGLFPGIIIPSNSWHEFWYTSRGVIWPVDWQVQLGWLWEKETILCIILIFGADQNVVSLSELEADSINWPGASLNGYQQSPDIQLQCSQRLLKQKQKTIRKNPNNLVERLDGQPPPSSKSKTHSVHSGAWD